MKCNDGINLLILVTALQCCKAVDQGVIDSRPPLDNVSAYENLVQVNSESYAVVHKFKMKQNGHVILEMELVDPFSGDKLDVSIEGLPKKDDSGSYRIGKSLPGNEVTLSYNYNDEGHIEGVISANFKTEDRFSGQWSFVMQHHGMGSSK